MKSIEQLCIKAKVQKSPEQIESAFMDLIESIVRHLSVIAIAAYRNSGCKNSKINKSILAQILMPSFGSWKNILEMLTTLDQTYFPDKFYDNFLMPLNKKLKNDIVVKAYTRINQLLEWATTEKDNFSFSQTNQSCNSKQFFQKMVEYRNRFGGHGTRGMPENLKISVEIIREGIIELSKLLRKNWINYPIYLAKKGELAGEEFIKLYSLIGNNNEKIEISEKKIKENQLIVCMNKQKSMFETLFPLAIWHDEDVMFFNGNKNFKRLLYIGYNSIESVFGTDKFEMQFIDYYLSFHALKLMPLDLLNEDNWNKAIELIKDNWVFPKLKKEMVFKNQKEIEYKLEKKLYTGNKSEIWLAKIVNNDETVVIKFLKNTKFMERFRREALVLNNLTKKGESKYSIKIYDFLLEPHPLKQTPFIVMEYLSGKSLNSIIEQNALYKVEDVIFWMEKSLNAILSFHKLDMVNRNVTPENLIFDANNNIKLIDLGLTGYSENSNPELCRSINCSPSSTAFDSPEFASPEQLLHGEIGKEVISKSDIFSIGAIFYFLLTEKYPFGQSTSEIVKRQTEADSSSFELRPVTEFYPDCPEFLSQSLLDMLNVSPEFRPEIETIIKRIDYYKEKKKNKKKNVKCVIHSTEDSDIKFRGLMPIWLNYYLFKIWPLALAIILISSAYLSVKLDVFNSIEISKISNANTIIFPYCKDFQFFAWIFISYSFIAILKRIVKSVQPIMNEIYSLDNDRHGPHWIKSKNRNDKWANFFHKNYLFALVLLLTVFQCYTTYNKVLVSIDNNMLFWSDWRISIWTFLLKECLVFVNGIGVIYSILFVIALIDLFTFILRGTKPLLDLYSSDNQNGLMCVGKLLGLFLPVFLVFLYGLGIILVSGFGQNNLHTIEHIIGIFMLSILYFFFILWPIYPIHTYIESCCKSEEDILKHRRFMIENKRKKYLQIKGNFNLTQTNEFLSLSALHENMLNQEVTAKNLHKWPLNKSSFLALSLIGLAPLFFAIIFLIYKI